MDQDFRTWVGRTETVADPLPFTQAQAAQAMLDDAGAPLADGDALPLPWHWFHFLPRAPQSRLDVDGHPQRGGFLPPIPYPRRMFAGARITVHRPLRIGQAAERQGTIRDVQMKSGKSGSLAFVTVGYRFVQGGELCLEEEQDIVYREPGAPVPAPVATEWPALPGEAWSRTVHPDSRLLFRFSALTFNAHRIHYDRAYATSVEGYPGLVVHGPLTAVLLLRLVQQHTPRPPKAFSFRGVAPLFDLGPVRLVGMPEGDTVTLEAQGPDGRTALSATVTLG
ncbi:MAG: acyl-CoA dehydrogenase [Rubrivivax sp.]|nr:acyl-CoA dehydrogenase [Rubrivivax sp.]